MKSRKNYQITEVCHRFVEDYIEPGDCCIDATCGNGYDTEFLCRAAGAHGRVYAFDIQEQAVINTKERLEAAGLYDRAVILNTGHETMDMYVKEEAAAIMFNFGYLPGGDHSLATRADTSVRAVSRGLGLLKKGGVMSLCIYSGQDTGYEERDALLKFVKELDCTKWLVLSVTYYNRKNDPPQPVFIIRLR